MHQPGTYQSSAPPPAALPAGLPAALCTAAARAATAKCQTHHRRGGKWAAAAAGVCRCSRWCTSARSALPVAAAAAPHSAALPSASGVPWPSALLETWSAGAMRAGPPANQGQRHKTHVRYDPAHTAVTLQLQSMNMLLRNSSTTSSILGMAYLLPFARHLLHQDGRKHATQAGPDLCGLLLVAAGAHAPHHDSWHVASQCTTPQPVHHLPRVRQTHPSRRGPPFDIAGLGLADARLQLAGRMCCRAHCMLGACWGGGRAHLEEEPCLQLQQLPPCLQGCLLLVSPVVCTRPGPVVPPKQCRLHSRHHTGTPSAAVPAHGLSHNLQSWNMLAIGGSRCGML